MNEMTERERNDIKMATLYEIRLIISQNNKETYTQDEILNMLDTIAISKDQK